MPRKKSLHMNTPDKRKYSSELIRQLSSEKAVLPISIHIDLEDSRPMEIFFEFNPFEEEPEDVTN